MKKLSFDCETLEANEVDMEPVIITASKDDKLAELKKSCNDDILAGFDSDAKVSGEFKHYGFEYEDQINMLGRKDEIRDGAASVLWKEKNGTPEPYLAAVFIKLFSDAKTSKEAKWMKYFTLEAQVEVLATAGQDFSGVHW